MQSVERYFSDTIDQLSLLTLSATALVAEIASLVPADVQLRCRELTIMQEKLSEDKEHFFAMMDFAGLGVLSTPYIGEFQRALDKSILACDTLHAVMLAYKCDIVASLR